MFGRQNDVIAQDQKRDADVPLPDDAMAALVKPPATTSDTDSPEPAKSAPVPAPPQPSTPPPAVDSFSPVPIAGSAMSPFDLIQKPVPAPAFAPGTASDSASSAVQTNDEPADEPIATGTDADEGTLLGSDDPVSTSHLDDDDDESATPSVVEPETKPEPESAAEPEPQEEKTDDASESADEEAPEPTEPAKVPVASDKLQSIKQEALSQLSPLVGQLNLDAEEKFRTLMMLIQASDNQELIPEAYEAAQKIENEQARAQALLDIVNEINYFTSKKDS